MTLQFSAEEGPPADLLAQVEELYRTTVQELFIAVNAIKAGRFDQSQVPGRVVRDLKDAAGWVMQERAQVDKLRKQIAGAAGTGRLDLDAARDEIGRRLACLRDARGG